MSRARLSTPPSALWLPLLSRALREDFGRAGDLTSEAVIPAGHRGSARVVARRGGRIAGLAVACETFSLLDGQCEVDLLVADGADVEAGEILASVRGPTRAILGAERTALNLLGRLCGIATATRDLVAVVAPRGARVADTRKTTPGLRALEKYAVRAGGGVNHRFGLDDAVLIKDNHLVIAGGVERAVARARERVGHLVKIEVECDTLDQVDAAVTARADVVLLDNMSPECLAEAVRRVGGRAITEASGGITLDSAAAIAASGVDILSVGWLTHSAPALDVALDVVE